MLHKSLIEKYITPLAPVETSEKQRGSAMEPIKGILFDIYGTLFIRSSGDLGITRIESQEIAKKMKRLLLKYAIATPPETLLNEFCEEIRKKQDALKKKGIDFPEVEIDRIWLNILDLQDITMARKFAVEYEMVANPIFPMPHLKEMLFACRNKKVLMGIVSNAQFFTPELFNWFLGAYPEHIGFHNELIFYSYEYGYAKPSLYLFELAKKTIKQMGIDLHSIVYLGNDMANDILPARQMGFQTALFAGDERSLRLRADDPRCKDVSPDFVITDLIQLIDYLK